MKMLSAEEMERVKRIVGFDMAKLENMKVCRGIVQLNDEL